MDKDGSVTSIAPSFMLEMGDLQTGRGGFYARGRFYFFRGGKLMEGRHVSRWCFCGGFDAYFYFLLFIFFLKKEII